MKALSPLSLFFGLMMLLAPSQDLWGQVMGPAKEDRIIAEASAVFTEIMEIPAKRIPRRMLQDAAGVAILPNVIKGGFVIGVPEPSVMSKLPWPRACVPDGHGD